MKKNTDGPEKSKKSGNWILRNIIKLIIIVAVVIVLTIVSKLPKKEQQTEVTEAAPINVKILDIKTESDFEDTISLPAVVEPNKIVTVSSEIAGRIENMPLEEGSKVNKGDILLELNTDLLIPQLKMAQAQLERNKIEYTRMSNLIESEATAQSDLDNALLQLEVSKAQYDEIKETLERATIKAPADGILNKIMVEEGEYIQPGMTFAEIVDNQTVKVVVDIPERDISFFSKGQKAEINFLYQGKEHVMDGAITYISELANELTRSTKIEIQMQNEGNCFRSGQIVRAVLTRQVLNNIIQIPLASVIPMETGNVVYIVEDDKAKRCDVELGIVKADNVQIKSGLAAGDKLIISGHRFVVPGQKVTTVPENQ